MLEPLVLFLLSLVLTLLLTPVMIRLANRKGFVDNPGVRKVHDHPIPRLGGRPSSPPWAAWPWWR